MADNMDDDIDAIIGKDDLELDELDNTPDTPEVPETPETPPEDDKPDAPDAGAEEPPKEGDTPETPPETPPEAPEAPTPLTKEDILSAINDARNEERTTAKELDELADNVLKQYYPSGLSNVLVDDASGKELRSPQDVVEASGGAMTTEEATQWLINEQYKLDQSIAKIKDEARSLAETNANFRTGIARVVDKYKDVFEKFPAQQDKIYKAYMKQVKLDNEKDLVLSAPDIEEYYDLVMEPYVLAYGNMQAQQPPAPSAPPAAPTPDAPQIPDSKPSIDDRLDESGDAGGSKREADPNNADETLSELFGE